ncbi:MAG: hypothetical protein JXL97_02940 [Bacteroidales bacterium]|nr:hypothetical protein [Bacteroidales bacterium]
MKRITLVLVAVFFVFFIITSCGNDKSTKETNDKEVINEVDDSDYYDEGELIEDDVFVDEYSEGVTSVEELVFVDGSAFEGEADLVFESSNGEIITFYLNYFDETKPELDYSFIGDDGMTANPELVGKTFIIEYVFVENGRITVEGDEEDCNIIYGAQML